MANSNDEPNIPEWIDRDRSTSYTRDPELVAKLAAHYPNITPRDGESELLRQVLRDRLEALESGMTPEAIFRDIRSIVSEHGGTMPVTIVNEDLMMPHDEGSMRIGLDEAGNFRLEELSREELDDLPLEDATPEELVRIIARYRDD